MEDSEDDACVNEPPNNTTADDGKYDKIVDELRRLNPTDPSFLMKRKMQFIEWIFSQNVQTFAQIQQFMKTVISKAHKEIDLAKKFALLFSERNVSATAFKLDNVRFSFYAAIEDIFTKAKYYSDFDRDAFYICLQLLGEFHHRVRLSNNAPIEILGQSILDLMIYELKKSTDSMDERLILAIVKQLHLNGLLYIENQKSQQLLYQLRSELVDKTMRSDMSERVKIYAMIVFDMYRLNFKDLSTDMKKFYSEQLVYGEFDQIFG